MDQWTFESTGFLKVCRHYQARNRVSSDGFHLAELWPVWHSLGKSNLRSPPSFPQKSMERDSVGWVTLWGFLSHTSVSRGNNSPSGWSLFHSGCRGSWQHGLTGQRVFGQLQVDKMIPTLNDSIIITENITTKYQLMASYFQATACQLKKQNLAFHSYIIFVVPGTSWINSQ